MENQNSQKDFFFSLPLESKHGVFHATNAEWQLTTEQQLKYQGTAKIDLDQVSFRASANTKVDQKKM